MGARTKRRIAVAAGVVLFAAFGVLSWIEADEEIEILCSFVRPGDTEKSVLATLDTGEYLHYSRNRPIVFQSVYNLHASKCTVTLSHGFVVATEYSESFRRMRIAGLVALAFLFGLGAFHLL